MLCYRNHTIWQTAIVKDQEIAHCAAFSVFTGLRYDKGHEHTCAAG